MASHPSEQDSQTVPTYLMCRSNFLDGANAVNYVSRLPIGVAGLISPWNLPLYLLTFKVHL